VVNVELAGEEGDARLLARQPDELPDPHAGLALERPLASVLVSGLSRGEVVGADARRAAPHHFPRLVTEPASAVPHQPGLPRVDVAEVIAFAVDEPLRVAEVGQVLAAELQRAVVGSGAVLVVSGLAWRSVEGGHAAALASSSTPSVQQASHTSPVTF